VKYSVCPKGLPSGSLPPATGAAFLRERLAAALKNGPAEFDFMIQQQTDPQTMPVENPAVIWDERVSPFVPVATLHIPAQEFDTSERNTFGENLSFNPWHALDAHKPLGGANLARRIIYEEMSAFRHSRNCSPSA